MSGGERLAAVFNFSECEQENYRVPIPGVTSVRVLLYSDWERFGGTTAEHTEVARMEDDELVCTLQPFSGILLDCCIPDDVI